MEQQPNNPELIDNDIDYLYQSLRDVLLHNTDTKSSYIEIRGVGQDPDKLPPLSYERKLPLTEMTELLGLDPSVETLTSAEIKFDQEHSINVEDTEPVYPTVWIDLKSQLQVEGVVIDKDEWYVLTETRPESYLSRSYVGVEFTSKYLDGQGELNEELMLLFDDKDELDRDLNQSDQQRLLEIAKLLES